MDANETSDQQLTEKPEVTDEHREKAKKVAEAAVVGYPHEIKGQGIYAYVTLMEGVEATDELRRELEGWVRREIGPIAKPDCIQWAPGLPKTRSGKILRATMQKIADGEVYRVPATIDDPAVLDEMDEALQGIGYASAREG